MNALARSLIWSLALLLCLLPVVALLNGWFASERWPLRQLRVTAAFERIDEAALRAAVQPHLAGGFFALDLAAIRQSVAALDWVAAVEVRKQFPDRLELRVEEHQPHARWGHDRLLSTSGALFALPAAGAPAGLPLFEADPRSLRPLLRVQRELLPLLQQHGFELDGLRLSARGSWSFRLRGGATVMAGRGDPLPRLRRFLPLLPPLLAHESRRLERADLRYANGFALRWAEPEAPGLGTRDSGFEQPPAALRPVAAGAETAPASLTAQPPVAAFPVRPQTPVAPRSLFHFSLVNPAT